MIDKKKKKIESIFGVPFQKNMPQVHTVGDLKRLLEEMHPDLPLAIFDRGYKPVWYNVGDKTEHLSFESNLDSQED
jgi:hypothetical protein